ncbi:hypothetical protein [Listeria booriae]|uniref:Uncharacterized protein n=1 Tax=Listeria booriae TaxID=1552123 RepID=A0A7X1DTF8_9LIST|nr:hypothetical protein [Listeria booriae]MBC1228784.1 hypothetical protein [Listeria booriae]MBC1318417.1 hypothetical protein [Listeria booriae]MBC2373603.1 hypothetical protein [Listeria booriae]
MANISNAFGTVTIPAEMMEENPNELVQLIQLMENELVRCDYNTVLSNDYAQICTHIQNSILPHELTLDFTGSGRWSYDNNIRSFFEWLLPENAVIESYSWLLELFKNKASHLTFSFVDYEQGCDVLYAATIQIRPKLLGNVLETEILSELTKDLPLTAAQLMESDFYEQAYDRHNAHELLDNEDFMNRLTVFIPRSFITPTFLTDAWTEFVLYIYDDESIFDQVISDIVDYYHHTHSLKP